MIEKIFESGSVFALIAGIAYLGGLAVAHIVEQATLRGLKAEGLEGKLQAISIMIGKFQARREAMLPQLVRLDAQVKSARRRHYMINKRVSDISLNRSRLLRVIGEEDAFSRPERPPRKFVAHVINRHVQRAQFDQKEHPFLARSWARSQQIEIWAPTIGDAKVAVEKVFPPATGFFMVEIKEPEAEGGDEPGTAASAGTPAGTSAGSP